MLLLGLIKVDDDNGTSSGSAYIFDNFETPITQPDIISFSFAEQTGVATPNSTNHTIDIEVANGTSLTNLIATFTLSDMATSYIGAT